ncbi:unnamed protein product [Effrenium voratum]|nr:unnamed protein product [Effrenium voratum]
MARRPRGDEQLVALARSRRWRSAAAVFECSTGGGWEGVRAFNALLHAFKGGRWARALRALAERWPRRPELASEVSLNSVLAALGSAAEWRRAGSLLAEMGRQRLEASSVTFGTIIQADGNGMQWHRALETLSNRISTVICFNSAIAACERATSWHMAVATLAVLPEVRVLPDVTTLNSAMSALAASEWQRAVCLFFNMPFYAMQADVVSYGSTLRSHWQVAGQLLRLMACALVRGNIITATSAVKASSARWEAAVRAFGDLAGVSLQATLVTYTTLVGALRSRWSMGLALKEQMGAAASRTDAIFGCELLEVAGPGEHRWRLVLGVFAVIKPNAFTRSSLASAFARTEKWEGALGCVSGGDLATANAALHGCARSAQWSRAVGLGAETRPNGITLSTLSDVLAAGQQWPAALRWLRLLGARRTSGVDFAICGTACISACEATGRWREALQVLEFLGTSADCAAVNCAIVACEKGEHFRRTHAHA